MTPRWHGYEHEQLAAMIKAGPGADASDGQTQYWNSLTGELKDIDDELNKALSELKANWEGAAGENANTGMTPLQQWAGDAQSGSSVMRISSVDQAEYISSARAHMPEPVTVTTPAPSTWDKITAGASLLTGDAGPAAAVAAQSADHEAQEAAKEKAAQKAVDTMVTYENSSTWNRNTLGTFVAPPDVVVSTPPPAGESSVGGAIGSAAGFGAAPGTREGSAQAAINTPGNGNGGQYNPPPPPPGDGGSGAPGSGGSGAPLPGGNNSGTDPSSGVPLPPAPPITYPTPPPPPPPAPGPSWGSPPLPLPVGGLQGDTSGGTSNLSNRPGGPSGLRGGPGGLPGGVPGGIDGDSRAAQLGRGGATGLGMAGEGVLGRGGPGGVGAAGVRGGAGMGGGPMGAGRGEGDEDDERFSPDYLLETTDVFGDARMVSPAVIGEDPSSEEK